MREQPPELAVAAERQQQIVTRGQLLAAGLDDMYLYRQTRRSQWQRVLPGTYALVTGTLTEEQRRIAAALYAGPQAQVTGLAALIWYGFRQSPRTDDVHLIVPHHARRSSAGFARVTRALALDAKARRATVYPVCSPARAVVDAARDLSQLRPVRAIVAESVQRGFTDLTRLDEEIRRARRSRTALVRKAFSEVVHGSRSAPEAELRTCLTSSRLLPEIRWNPRLVAGDGGSLPTPDGYLADAAVALEVDSQEYHFNAGDWARTLDRHNEMSRHGILILHFTPAQIRREPGRVRRMVEDAYESRRGLGAANRVRVEPVELPGGGG
ncbi:type IV toxin-antitoxin system AbiEi family antitoxin domain-containing protein [Micromonospora sp. DSM 115977]|uniref:Type IV toxin-antitoxin system AbiEi family antitoxin domain-containing protein n=1 Tax=Micromonospora reichwaldensis TaxID=3075516 RepID=A0ABU2X565_9ACTN|nr:type IV toxin-antitoxin system AbiEi family antitoxin domain-containing protein [Micromonospora sp. DSM 115977]MDT0533326.1 type IV toxin-antitoxin system AbiEi family antitoxin domain-containing protein [Micromonospora sp. DSM 115977]